TCVKTRLGSDNSFLGSALRSSTASSPARKPTSSIVSFGKERAGRCNRVLPPEMQIAVRAVHLAANDAQGYLTMADWDRTACHWPLRFTNTSIHTHLPLVSFPLPELFSVSLPWTTATVPITLTSMGPNSNDSSLFT